MAVAYFRPWEETQDYTCVCLGCQDHVCGGISWLLGLCMLVVRITECFRRYTVTRFELYYLGNCAIQHIFSNSNSSSSSSSSSCGRNSSSSSSSSNSSGGGGDSSSGSICIGLNKMNSVPRL